MATTTQPAGFSRAFTEARTGVARRPTPADAFEAARQAYLAGRRLDMRELAQSLGVSRTTLYRWCGNREELLTEVIWSVTEELIHAFEEATTPLRGRERLRRGIRLFLEHSAHDPALRALLDHEGHIALRLMTASGDGRSHQDRVVAELARIIEEEDQRADLRLHAPAALVAYTIGRVMGGFIYDDAIAAVDPQIDKAMEVLDFLLAERAPGGA
jgi:AcrR family transcriptional regulator